MNTEEQRRQHRLLFMIVANHVLDKHLEKLKSYCMTWIAPATLQNITTTEKLLDQLEMHGVIGIGNYVELIKMLEVHGLLDLKAKVEQQAELVGFTGSTPPPLSTPPVDRVEKLTDVTVTMGISSGPTEKLTISPGPNHGNPMVCDVQVSNRIRKFQLVWDGLAICSGVTAQAKGYKSKGGAVEHAMREITPKLLGSGVRVQYGDKWWTT